MSNFPVAKDKAPPVPKERYRYPWEKMKAGECFYFTEADPVRRTQRETSCRVSGLRYFRRRGGKLTVITTVKKNRVKVSVVKRKGA